jgi:hypothetical protein
VRVHPCIHIDLVQLRQTLTSIFLSTSRKSSGMGVRYPDALLLVRDDISGNECTPTRTAIQIFDHTICTVVRRGLVQFKSHEFQRLRLFRPPIAAPIYSSICDCLLGLERNGYNQCKSRLLTSRDGFDLCHTIARTSDKVHLEELITLIRRFPKPLVHSIV